MANKLVSDIRGILFSSSVAKLLDILKTFVVLRVLTPAEFGILSIFMQVKMLSKYGDIGFISVLEKEYNTLGGAGHFSEAERRRNYSISFDLVLMCLLIVATLIVGLAYFTIEPYLILAICISLFANKLLRLLQADNRIKSKFSDFSKIQVTFSILSTFVVILFIYPFGLLAPTLINSIAVTILVGCFFYKYSFSFVFSLSKSELKRQFLQGIKLSLITVSFGVGVYAERFVFIEYGTMELLGYFSLGLFAVTLVNYFVLDVVRVLIPRIRKKIGSEDYVGIRKLLLRPIFYSYILALFFCIMFHLLAEPVLSILLPKYVASLDMIEPLMLVVPITIASNFMGFILYSSGVEKERHVIASHVVYSMIIFGSVLFYDQNASFLYFMAVVVSIANAVRSLIQLVALRFGASLIVSPGIFLGTVVITVLPLLFLLINTRIL